MPGTIFYESYVMIHISRRLCFDPEEKSPEEKPPEEKPPDEKMKDTFEKLQKQYIKLQK